MIYHCKLYTQGVPGRPKRGYGTTRHRDRRLRTWWVGNLSLVIIHRC